MKPRSLRARLALWHAGLLGLTLLALAALTYVLLLRMLHSRSDAELERYAEVTAKNIAADLFRASVEGPTEPRFIADDPHTWGRYVQVVDARGSVVRRSDALASRPLPVSAETLLRAQRGKTTFETIEGLGEHPVRVVTVPVQMGARVPYLVQAGLSLEGIEGTLQRASLILVVLTPSVFLVALIGGWSLVGRALRPVEELTRTALEMESRSLSRRLVPPVSDDEIGRLAGAFDTMIARLERSFRQVQQFSADASHELGTPLTAIRGEAEVALMRPLTPEQYQRALRSILESAQRMSCIIEDLLMLARLENDRAVRRESVTLDDLLLAVYELHEPLARRGGLTLEIVEAQEATVLGDPLWLQQMMANLVNNAIKYTPASGRVALSLIREAAEAVLTVTDTGAGIALEHLPYIFDRFYRVDSGRSRDSGGSGLGLSIVQWVAEAHGGRVEVTSVPGKQTRFTVRLPLHSGDPS
jgi:heavy metal sensor kinase